MGVIWRPAPKEKLKPREVPLFAYWLPYQANRTHELMLGDKANFFFTAGLSGCTVIVTEDPRNPRVAHINRTVTAASVPAHRGRTGYEVGELEKRRAQVTGESFQSRMPTPTKEELTTRQMMLQELKSKVAAKEQGRTNDVLGICTWGVHYTTLASVFGVRNVGTGVWNFYRQRYQSAPAVGKLQKLGLILRRDGELEKMC